MNYWIWAIGALFVAIFELHWPGSYLIWIAAGAAITSLSSFLFDLSLPVQVGIFVVSCAIACGCGYFVYQKITLSTAEQPQLNQKHLEMIGMRGVVTEALEDGRGKVKLGDSVWIAEGKNATVGTPIIVTRMNGTVVVVSQSAN